METNTIEHCIKSVKQFHDAYFLSSEQNPTADIKPELIELRHKLMAEENDEYLEAAATKI